MTTTSVTMTSVMTALRSFILTIVPAGVGVVQGQINRVPEPIGADWVQMTALFQRRLATNVDTTESTGNLKDVLTPTEVTIQIDVRGPNSASNAQMISALLRDEYATSFFAASDTDVAPLSADDAKQMPFENDQSQVEERWSIDALFQVNPVASVPQQSTDVLTPTLYPVETLYP